VRGLELPARHAFAATMLDARNGLTGSDLRRPPPELQLHTQPVRSRTHLRQSIYGAQPKVCQTAK
jgi:hypothetical protein